ncbi:MAG: aspartate aminotransferase family protein [Bacteroidetes bacterium]|nr:aspartate aminotransferase family protein [Bacteroidota bacterium]
MNIKQLFSAHLAPTSPIPLGIEVSHAEGCYIFDTAGKKYLDLISGISVSALGHRHPKIIEAIENQLGKYLHIMVYGEFIQAPQVKLAKLLADNLPPNLDCVYFTNSGSEATEGAMKLAKRITGRSEIISFTNAYHGSTQGALSIAGAEWLKQNFRPLLPCTNQIRYNNFKDLEKITTATAAVFIEPLQGEAGAQESAIGFLKAVRERCTKTNTLLVFDEIQTGFGRTGSLWHFQQHNVIPDILLLGKALGGGLPLGAFIASKEMMQNLNHNPVLGHITTFGGHPLSCAAGLVALEIILQEKITERVGEKEALFRKYLTHPNIKTIRGKGLLLAIDVGSFEKVQTVINYCIANGVITDWFLFNENCIRLVPPLIITQEEIEMSCKVILEGMELI